MDRLLAVPKLTLAMTAPQLDDTYVLAHAFNVAELLVTLRRMGAYYIGVLFGALMFGGVP